MSEKKKQAAPTVRPVCENCESRNVYVRVTGEVVCRSCGHVANEITTTVPGPATNRHTRKGGPNGDGRR